MFAKRPVPAPEPQQFSDSLITTRAFDPDSHVFLCDDNHLFFGFLCMTLSGLDNGLDDRLNGLLNQDWPDDTLMQCGLVSSPDLMQTIGQLLALQGHMDNTFSAMLDQNIRQLQGGCSPNDDQ